MNLSRFTLLFYSQHSDLHRLVSALAVESDGDVMCRNRVEGGREGGSGGGVHCVMLWCFQVTLCQKWIQFRVELSSLILTSPPCLLHLSRLLTWSCDAISAPSINPTLLLRTIEVFLDPSTYLQDHTASTSHAPNMIRHLSRHLIQNRFFHSLLQLLQLKTPPPEDVEPTPTPLASSLLGYLTRPLLSGCEDGGVYESLANEILSLSLSPHVSYHVLPHLRNSSINVPALVHSVLAGVVSGGVTPSLQLLYSVLELAHAQLPMLKGEGLLQTYLKLVSVLLSSHTPLVPVGVSGEEEGEEEEGEGMEVEEPLSCPEAMLRHCLATLGGSEIPTALHQQR